MGTHKRAQAHDSERTYTQTTANLDSGLISDNVQAISAEVAWLQRIIETRLGELATKGPYQALKAFSTPPLIHESSAYHQLIDKFKLSPEERLLLILGFVPHYSPAFLTHYFRDEQNKLQVIEPLIGGLIKSGSRQFVPTFQTFLFLLVGNDHQQAAAFELGLREKSWLLKEGIILHAPLQMGSDPSNNYEQLIIVSPEYVDHVKSGRLPRPSFGPSFPATLETTVYEWDDLVIPPVTAAQLSPMLKWLEHRDLLLTKSKKFSSSAPVLFYGAPGTGKSLTAKLIGKKLKQDVFRIDLSMIVSKYIGETEKNLAHLFDRAEDKNWILFFDEADALFSKRTDVSSSNDKWANLEVSYLLQRMESFKGISILTSNLRENIDPAMTRRFRYMVDFQRPTSTERNLLWQKALPPTYSYANDFRMEILAKENLTGANIANIVFDCCVEAESQDTNKIGAQIIRTCVMREMHKEDRTPDFIASKPKATIYPDDVATNGSKTNTSKSKRPKVATLTPEEREAHRKKAMQKHAEQQSKSTK